MIEDRLQPHAEHLEVELIHAILNDNTIIESVHKLISVNAFYAPAHSIIFNAAKNNYLSKLPVTSDAIIETLKETGKLIHAGGIQGINEIRYKQFSSIDATFNAAIIFQKYIRREAIRAAHITLNNAYDETKDEFNLLDDMLSVIGNIHNHLNGATSKTIGDFVDAYYKETIELINSGNKIRGIRTHLTDLDYRLGGLCSGRMILFAGRPGMGKTAFIIQLIINVCLDKNKSKLPIVIYSMEMSGEELVNRLVSGLMKYAYHNISKGDLPVEMHATFERAVNHVKQSSLHIVDNMNDLRSISADLRLRKERDGIKVAIIDYLQLMRDTGKHSNREQELGHVSRSIKSLAKELKIPIVPLVQLNRDIEKRSGKEPQLSDLRDTGSLEMDADSVTFIHRPIFTGIETDQHGNKYLETDAFAITVKNRHGPTGKDEMFCDISCNIFSNKKEEHPFN